MFAATNTTSVLIALSILLAGCSFGHKNYPGDPAVFHSPQDFIVQVDDFGQFWDASAAEKTLQAIQDSASKTNTVVVLFIHGWHHNASADDKHLGKFANSLQAIRATLEDNEAGQPGPYRTSRLNLTGDGRINVLGVYVGWRGKSLPMPLDYLTFWGRKAAAERVGNGDLREFLLRLDAIYKAQGKARREGRTRSFMGFVSIGHSFGGQVLFQSVSRQIESELIHHTARPESSLPGQTPGADQLEGFGDLVVLVNPALEAMQYERIHNLGRQLKYAPSQAPLMLVVSSEGDWARQLFFPLGRQIDALLRPAFRGEQRALWTQALGEYELQRTHSVKLTVKDRTLLPGFDPAVYVDNPAYIANFDLTNIPSIAGVELKPTGIHQPFNPFIVAYADREIVFDHSQIFEDYLPQFLNDYVAILQGKKMLTGDAQSSLPVQPLSRNSGQ
jgi:hypothetical protein